ncbi:MAG: Gfo/Idh/MocA family oxidoreductase, partial [Pseudomonadota bacterium]
MTGLRIGVLGAARITPKAVVQPASRSTAVSIVACAARDARRAEAFARKWDIPEAFDTYEALVNAPEIDLIYNPLPINLHAAWTLKALAAGKHVLCEKPFAMNADEAAAMIAAGEQHGRRVIEAFHYRYHPAFARLIGWLRGGELGAITSIEAHFNAPIANVGGEIRHQVETGGGAMMDLGCYCLHQILSVMDTKPVKIRAQARLTPQGVDETMQATLTFAGGVT